MTQVKSGAKNILYTAFLAYLKNWLNVTSLPAPVSTQTPQPSAGLQST